MSDANGYYLMGVEDERRRIAERIREMRVLRLEVGVDPLQQINDVLSELAHDVETGWTDYDE